MINRAFRVEFGGELSATDEMGLSALCVEGVFEGAARDLSSADDDVVNIEDPLSSLGGEMEAIVIDAEVVAFGEHLDL